jgi:hypothetical protein
LELSRRFEAAGPWSLRWSFENRENGRITVAQFPDRPLFEIGGESLIGSAADGSTTQHRRSGSERGAQNDTARQPVATVQNRPLCRSASH